MPSQCQRQISYWTVCVFTFWFLPPIPYPCKKWKTEDGWCYNFCNVNSYGYLFFSFHVACEHGVKFAYWEWGGGFGTSRAVNVEKRFDHKLQVKGTCNC